MNPKDHDKDKNREPRTDPRPDDRGAPEKKSAPPIEREHETQAGVLDEDERRKKEGR